MAPAGQLSNQSPGQGGLAGVLVSHDAYRSQRCSSTRARPELLRAYIATDLSHEARALYSLP